MRDVECDATDVHSTISLRPYVQAVCDICIVSCQPQYSNLLLYHHAQAPYSMRALEEIIGEIDAATMKNDAAALQRLADELEGRSEPAAIAEHGLARGTACSIIGNNAEALEHYERTLTLYEGLGNLARVAVVANDIGNVHVRLGDYSKAIKYYERALRLREDLGEKSGVARVTGNIGIVHAGLGNYPKALEYYERALQFYEELGEKSGVASITGNIGIVHYNLGDFSKALEFFSRVLQLQEDLDAKSSVAVGTGNIGNVHASLGNYPKALEYYNRALQLHEELGEKSGIARTILNIGYIHSSLGDYPKALEYYNRALQMHEELGMKSGIARDIQSIGTVHSDLGNYSVALEYHNRALRMHEELGEKSGVETALANITLDLVASNQLQEAHAYVERMIKMDITEPFTGYSRATAVANLAEAESNYDAAHLAYNEALDLAKEHGLRAHESWAHLKLRDLARKRGDFDGYIKHNDEHTRIKEEIAGAEAKLKMAAAEVEQRMARERRERDKERALLYGALPESIVNRMLKGEDVSGDEHAQVTVLFMDIVGFTSLCSKIPPAHVVHLLKTIFAVCDKVSAEHGLTKIKTIGDSYMAASGVPEYQADHAVRAARAGLTMQEQLQALQLTMDQKLGDTTWTKDVGEIRVRIGLHTGAVVAGVVGEERLQYDIWGDTVNVASRMESTGTPGKVHVSQSVAEALQRYATQVQNNEHDLASPLSPRLVERDSVEVKGKGTMKTYWLEGM